MSKQLKMGVRNKKARVLLPAVFVGGGAPVLASGGRASPRAEAEATTYAYDAVGRLIREGGKSYAYGYLDKVMSVRENNNLLSSFDYAVSGQIASATRGDQKESFLWDGLALIHRDGVNYLNEPHPGGGAPVLASSSSSLRAERSNPAERVFFNDLLGTTVGTFDSNGKFASTSMTTYGDDASQLETRNSQLETGADSFFTGKPHIQNLGYAFLLRNYRADLGKWSTADPWGYPDGLNNFAYVNGRVTSAVDWMGAWEITHTFRFDFSHTFEFLDAGEDGNYTDFAGLVLPDFPGPPPTELNWQELWAQLVGLFGNAAADNWYEACVRDWLKKGDPYPTSYTEDPTNFISSNDVESELKKAGLYESCVWWHMKNWGLKSVTFEYAGGTGANVGKVLQRATLVWEIVIVYKRE